MKQFESHTGNNPIPETKRASLPLEIDRNTHDDVTRELLRTATELERHAVPNMRIDIVRDIPLTEPVPDDLQGIIPRVHSKLTMIRALHDDDTQNVKLTIASSAAPTTTFSLETNPLLPLTNWSVEAGDKQWSGIDHGALLNYLLERTTTAFVPAHIIDHPSLDDETVISYLLDGLGTLDGAQRTNASYYHAKDFALSDSSLLSYEYEVDALVGIVKTAEKTEYISRIKTTTDTLRPLVVVEADDIGPTRFGVESTKQEAITQTYKYVVDVPVDYRQPVKHQGQVILESADLTSRRLEELTHAQQLAADSETIFHHSLDLVIDQHLNYDRDLTV